MSWGIAPTAPEIEKIKAESADFLHGYDSCGVLDWRHYSDAFDFYEELLMKAYRQGRSDILHEAREKITCAGNEGKRSQYHVEGEYGDRGWMDYTKGIRDACWAIDKMVEEEEQQREKE